MIIKINSKSSQDHFNKILSTINILFYRMEEGNRVASPLKPKELSVLSYIINDYYEYATLPEPQLSNYVFSKSNRTLIRNKLEMSYAHFNGVLSSLRRVFYGKEPIIQEDALNSLLRLNLKTDEITFKIRYERKSEPTPEVNIRENRPATLSLDDKEVQKVNGEDSPPAEVYGESSNEAQHIL